MMQNPVVDLSETRKRTSQRLKRASLKTNAAAQEAYSNDYDSLASNKHDRFSPFKTINHN
jgi:hypothetical protein